jgi:REP element-mobilizing transposase RayT
MPRPRKQLVSVADTPYYHVTSRCVRRAFLCGEDKLTGRSYEHRRDWIETRIRILSTLFAIDLCAYAIMSNHYHLVVKLLPNDATQWTDDEVLERWCSLHKGTILVQRYRAGLDLGDAETATVRDTIAVYRKRLADLSWFMKCLNEPVARRANGEDGCTGHFWEARFSSQALRTDTALLTCMVYVDLNPIRAGMSKTPELSDYTSIRERLSPSENLDATIKETLGCSELKPSNQVIRPLLPFANAGHSSVSAVLPMPFRDYLKLIDTTGRTMRRDKRAAIDPTVTPILERLQLSEDQWISATTNFEQMYRRRQRIV